jgi:hypothetical protein
MPGQSNEERLREAGVLRDVELPKAHSRVVKGLTPKEVDVLIAVKTRLEAADEWLAIDPEQSEVPPPDQSAHFTRLMPY